MRNFCRSKKGLACKFLRVKFSNRGIVKKKAKKGLTLIEVMVVMMILGLITGLFMRNTTGRLEEGKAFRTEQGSRQVQEVLAMQIAMGIDKETIVSRPDEVLKAGRIFTDPKAMLKDGWGNQYTIEIADDDEVYVRSDRFLQYMQNKKDFSDEVLKEKYSWMFPPAKMG